MTDSADRRFVWLLALSVVLQVGFGGLRFNDGSSLVAFARDGFGAELRPGFEYLLDSQLKVLVLYWIGADQAWFIGLFFLCLNILPYLTVFFLKSEFKNAVLLFIALTPFTKVLAQNVGIGDSVQLAIIIGLVFSRSFLVSFAISFLIILWHFQQGVILLLLIVVLFQVLSFSRLLQFGHILGLICGVVSHYVIKGLSGRVYAGRLEYVAEVWLQDIYHSMFFLPLMILVVLPGIYIVWLVGVHQFEKRVISSIIAIGVVALVLSMIVIDRSRVLFILTFPIFMCILRKEKVSREIVVGFADLRIFLPIVFFSAVIPLSANQNIDIYVWSALVEDVRRWLH